MADQHHMTHTPPVHAPTAAALLPVWLSLREAVSLASSETVDGAVTRLFDMSYRIAEAPALTAADALAKLSVALRHARIEHDDQEGLPFHWSVVETAAADLAAL